MVTFWINRAVYRGHKSASSIVTEESSDTSWADSRMRTSGIFIFFPVRAATSRAMPIMLRQSERLGVMPMSRTVSPRSRASCKGLPKAISAGSCRMPDASSPISSSASEQSMPSDFSPRSVVDLMVYPPGMTAPVFASGTMSPA